MPGSSTEGRRSDRQFLRPDTTTCLTLPVASGAGAENTQPHGRTGQVLAKHIQPVVGTAGEQKQGSECSLSSSLWQPSAPQVRWTVGSGPRGVTRGSMTNQSSELCFALRIESVTQAFRETD